MRRVFLNELNLVTQECDSLSDGGTIVRGIAAEFGEITQTVFFNEQQHIYLSGAKLERAGEIALGNNGGMNKGVFHLVAGYWWLVGGLFSTVRDAVCPYFIHELFYGFLFRHEGGEVIIGKDGD